MQNAALQHIGAGFVYLPFAVPPSQLRAAVEGARALGARGLNLTIPHKEAALDLCEPDELARRVGAVNTLIFDEERIRGTNTDVHGFGKLMEEAGIGAPRKVIVLGAGGAARAVVAALSDATGATHATGATDATEITLVARTRKVFSLGGRDYPVEPWAALERLLPDADLIVDATPRGLDDRAEPIDLSSTRATVLDLVVRRETALVRAARARGLVAQAGAAMLLHQGAAAFEHWVGRPAPVEIMRRALDAALD
jgi:shikimate dehydrogenase